MSVYEKITKNKNLLLGLVVLLLCVSAVQSYFLIKLYKSVEHGNSAEELSQELEKEFKFKDDFFKPFDDHSWSSFDEFQNMRDRMDRMFNDSYNRFSLSPFFDENKKDTFLPQTDLIEEDDRYVVKMNIPGSEKAEIQVDVEGEKLTVKAKTQTAQKKEDSDSYLRMERRMGSFQRALTLPGPVDSGAMETEYEDGVLTIILPKIS
ncbi:MAG: Hsp20/alpha crystallin family protein [Desulfobulbaceae bacterium]|nr:Hsp20/alpha crystallin family protein [Desulfobulbaceae bacterium]